ncbi:MAG: hypothetical protein KDA85_05325, partial [Planctomycetaceae bacterium]|nr:hypothetical protein [Planctomycetaceae bacterium]
FRFFSDCLWAAPLGLMQASGDLAPCREWEYLLIPGDVLKARKDRYVLQMTEELWETTYLDDVKLIAVDHPADVSVFTNEKVGSPQLAAHRIHTVRNRRLPVSVVDSRGHDLLPGLKRQDGNYVKPFTHRKVQGLVDPWSMEFDLGEIGTPSNVRLVLTGWVYPTSVNLNEGILQNPDLSPPAPPSIEIPDGQGGWQTVIPFIGFPGGKTKAMVIDLTDALKDGQSRVRVSSSMELYWDEAFFTLDESDEAVVVNDCPLQSADLHYLGFPRRMYHDNSLFRNGLGPEDYDHSQVQEQMRWPPIMGRFTRYGQTQPLLTAQDDQMVVMGPGDELTLEFQVPVEPVPDGWVRDFVIYNVGWDKDANLNTVLGQSSEPYPHSRMTQYPFSLSDSLPDSPEYQGYLREYQTREYHPDAFWKTPIAPTLH